MRQSSYNRERKGFISDSVDGTIETVAFRNPDGTEVLIALNPTDGSQWFDVQRGDEYFSYRLVKKIGSHLYVGCGPFQVILTIMA